MKRYLASSIVVIFFLSLLLGGYALSREMRISWNSSQKIQADQLYQVTWFPTQRVTWNSGASEEPDISCNSSGNFYVVWQDDTSGNAEIHFKMGTGTAWGNVKRITWNAGESCAPKIAVDSSDNIHIVWYDDSSGNNEIYYKKSTNGGTTWTAPIRLTYTSGDSTDPVITTWQDSRVHVAWTDYISGHYHVNIKISTNGGTSWQPTKRLTWTSSNLQPSIDVDSSGEIHLVWCGDISLTANEIFYKKSSDIGANWSSKKRLSWTWKPSFQPDLIVDSSNNIHVVWRDKPLLSFEIYYRNSSDFGNNWSGNPRRTYNNLSALNPALAEGSSGIIFIVWSNATLTGWDIYKMESENGGSTWTPMQRKTYTSGTSGSPAVDAFTNNALHIVWHDSTPGNYEIFYKRRINKVM